MTQGFINNGGASAGVSDISAMGSTPLTGSVTLCGLGSISVTQSGQEIYISGCGGGGSPGGYNQDIQVNCGGTALYGDDGFRFDFSVHSLIIGCGPTTNCSNYSIVHGNGPSGALAAGGAIGNHVYGDASSGGNIQTVCSASGATAHGVACSYGCNIYAVGIASDASGYVIAGGTIQANDDASVARGVATSCGSIYAYGAGSEASGAVANCGTIETISACGGKAFGFADGASALIQAFCSGALAHGETNCAGSVQAWGSSHAHGLATNCSLVGALGTAGHAHGYAYDNAQIYVASNGGIVYGQAGGYGSLIIACGYGGNVAGGYVTDCGTIGSSGGGSHAWGYAVCGAGISSTAFGSQSYGTACSYGTILSSGPGSDSSGYSQDSGSSLQAISAASSVKGYVTGGGYVAASGAAAIARGVSFDSGSSIVACGDASEVRGVGINAGTIIAYDAATSARGYATNCGDIAAVSIAAEASGYANGYDITACGYAATARGHASSGTVIANGDNAFAHGDNIIACGYSTYAFGSGFTNSQSGSFQVGFGSPRFKVNANNESVYLGYSAMLANEGGVIADFLNNANNSGSSETDLRTVTIPSQALAFDGDKLTAEFSGEFVASLSNKRIRATFAGTTIFDTTSLAFAANSTWSLSLLFMRTGTTTASIRALFFSTSVSLPISVQRTDISGQDFTISNDLILKATGGATDEVRSLAPTTYEFKPQNV